MPWLHGAQGIGRTIKSRSGMCLRGMSGEEAEEGQGMRRNDAI